MELAKQVKKDKEKFNDPRVKENQNKQGSWEYRIMKEKDGTFGLHEVYYTRKGIGRTENSVCGYYEDIKDLVDTVRMMHDATMLCELKSQWSKLVLNSDGSPFTL